LPQELIYCRARARAAVDAVLACAHLLKDGVRLPRDFDSARYPALNPDVNFNARRHYLYRGAAEDRRYK
jgi:hypothetical protein